MKQVIIHAEFEEYVVSKKEMFNGEAVRLLFPNGYGASVINHNGSYGLECGVLYKDSLTYNTPITDDVIGHLDQETLGSVLKAIQSLPYTD